MLSFAKLADLPGVSVTAVTCRHERSGWSEAESSDNYRVVLVRRGRFRRRARGGELDLDPTLAYVGVPGEAEHFAHPTGGDVCTLISLSPPVWSALAGDGRRIATSIYVDAALDLAHRRALMAGEGDGDQAYAVAERLVGMVGGVVGRVATGTTPSDPGADQRLVVSARLAIDEGRPWARALLPLAEHLGVSPYRLSRAFTRSLGVSLTRYRNRVRVGHALDRLEGGESNLAALAAELGFADQAHLSRTVREHVGHPPASLRRLLRRQPVRPSSTS